MLEITPAKVGPTLRKRRGIGQCFYGEPHQTPPKNTAEKNKQETMLEIKPAKVGPTRKKQCPHRQLERAGAVHMRPSDVIMASSTQTETVSWFIFHVQFAPFQNSTRRPN